MSLHDTADAMDVATTRARIDVDFLRTIARDLRSSARRASNIQGRMPTDQDAIHCGGAVDRATSAAVTLDRLADRIAKRHGL